MAGGSIVLWRGPGAADDIYWLFVLF
jgi:hypothetical protein